MTLEKLREGHLEELGRFSNSILPALEGLEVSTPADAGST